MIDQDMPRLKHKPRREYKVTHKALIIAFILCLAASSYYAYSLNTSTISYLQNNYSSSKGLAILPEASVIVTASGGQEHIYDTDIWTRIAYTDRPNIFMENQTAPNICYSNGTNCTITNHSYPMINATGWLNEFGYNGTYGIFDFFGAINATIFSLEVPDSLNVTGNTSFSGDFETPCLHCEGNTTVFHGAGVFEGNVTAPNLEVMESLIVHGNSTCSGTAIPCGDAMFIGSPLLCGYTVNAGQRGCRWRIFFGDCVGTATPCEDMPLTTCALQHNCVLTSNEGFTFGDGGFTGNITFTGNQTIVGNLNVTGNVESEEITSKKHLSANGSEIISAPAFTGTGLNDMVAGGTYTAPYARTYRVQINSTGTPDRIRWSMDAGTTWTASAISITGAYQALTNEPVMVKFAAATGHTLNDYWVFTATPDLGIVSSTADYELNNHAMLWEPQATSLSIGNLAMGGNKSTGERNTVAGYRAGYSLTSGSHNMLLGPYSGQSLTSGSRNVMLGSASGFQTTTGDGNFFLGMNVGYSNTVEGGNTYIGHDSGYSPTGRYNTFLGLRSGNQVTTGGYDVAVGAYSMDTIATAQPGYNTAIGYESMKYLTSGTGNTGLGRQAGVESGNGTKSNTIAIGNNAHVNGNDGVAIGSDARATANMLNVSEYIYYSFLGKNLTMKDSVISPRFFGQLIGDGSKITGIPPNTSHAGVADCGAGYVVQATTNNPAGYTCVANGATSGETSAGNGVVKDMVTSNGLVQSASRIAGLSGTEGYICQGYTTGGYCTTTIVTKYVCDDAACTSTSQADVCPGGYTNIAYICTINPTQMSYDTGVLTSNL